MMIDASFIKEIVDQASPVLLEKGDRSYAVTKNGAHEILPTNLDPNIRYAPALDLTSLDGLVDYCKDNNDGATSENHFVRIGSPNCVSLLRDADVNGIRNCAAVARTIKYDYCSSFYDYDSFVAHVLKWFHLDEDVAKLLDVASRVKDEQSAETDDNGVSQTVTVKVGAASVSKEKLRNPVYLLPNALFPEVKPIPQPHIFRIHSAEKGDRFTLKCVAASNWNADVAQLYANYLLSELPGWRILR